MSRVQFKVYLRALLGRGYSVADEEGGADGILRLIVLRRGADNALVVETVDGWIRSLQESSREDRVLIKHLAIYIRRYFSHPEYVPERQFAWPGTPRSRGQIRLALDPRNWRRGAKGQEG